MSSVIRMPNQERRRKGGVKIGCFRVCKCINVGFFTSQTGMLKLFQLLLGSCCETLLLKFGLKSSGDIGQAFHGFLTTVSTCLTTTFLLMICYFASAKTEDLVRSSLFEIAYNTMACLLYAGASGYMVVVTKFWLYPRFLIQPSYMAYPAMTCVYYVGIINALVYLIDALMAYKEYRSAN